MLLMSLFQENAGHWREKENTWFGSWGRKLLSGCSVVTVPCDILEPKAEYE